MDCSVVFRAGGRVAYKTRLILSVLRLLTPLGHLLHLCECLHQDTPLPSPVRRNEPTARVRWRARIRLLRRKQRAQAR